MLNEQREQLRNYIKTQCINNLNKPKVLQSYGDKLIEKYNLASKDFNGIFNLKQPLDETVSDGLMFCIVSVMNEEMLPRFFSEQEIKKYSKLNYAKKKSKTLRFKMIEVKENSQWIGKVTVRDIEKLSDLNMIHYEETTQRPLTRKTTNNGEEYFQISINKTAVAAITESFMNNNYIPNTITLNMPENTVYEYSEDNCELIIRDIDYFDVIDGYHRYVSMIKSAKLNKDFDYIMELRIVSFSTDRARQFIWQEDQKTKMKRVDSQSYNINNAANKVISMLKDKAILNDVIDKKGIIDPSYLSFYVREAFEDIKKSDELKTIIDVKNKLSDGIMIEIENNPDCFKKAMDRYETYALYMSIMHDSNKDEILKKAKENKDKFDHAMASNSIKRIINL